MAFNLMDILLLVLVLLSVLGGYRRGFILGVLDLAGWVLNLLAGLRFYPPLAHWLGAYVHSLPQIWNRPIAFIFVAIVVGAAVHLLGNLILKGLPKEIHQRRINRLFRIIPGFANGLITAATWRTAHACRSAANYIDSTRSFDRSVSKTNCTDRCFAVPDWERSRARRTRSFRLRIISRVAFIARSRWRKAIDQEI